MSLLRRPVESAGRVVGGAPDRFPGFDVLGEADRWDASTAGVVLARLTLRKPIRYFGVDEEAVGRALFDRLLDQRCEPRVPVLEMIDARLAEAETDGWHYADLPEDGDAFRASFAALNVDAQRCFGLSFVDLEPCDQDDLIQAVHDIGGDDWHGMTASRIWSLWTRYGCTAFYSHPWAWNEIGFGGPAYPRGYKNLGVDAREPWEVRDAADEDPVGRGNAVEEARRQHARARSRQLVQLDQNGPRGVGPMFDDRDG